MTSLLIYLQNLQQDKKCIGLLSTYGDVERNTDMVDLE